MDNKTVYSILNKYLIEAFEQCSAHKIFIEDATTNFDTTYNYAVDFYRNGNIMFSCGGRVIENSPNIYLLEINMRLGELESLHGDKIYIVLNCNFDEIYSFSV